MHYNKNTLKLSVFAILIVLSNSVIADDNIRHSWKRVNMNEVAYYSQNGMSKVMLSHHLVKDIDVSLYTVNSSCTPIYKNISGEAFFYINKTNVAFNYACISEGTALFWAKNIEGRKYLVKEFKDKNEVCYGQNKEIKGLCFNAIGFNDALQKLNQSLHENENAL